MWAKFCWFLYLVISGISKLVASEQWHNSLGVGGWGWGGAECPFWHFSPGNFCWSTGKREASKKGKMEKGKVENWKWKGDKLENEERTLFFTFQNHWNLLWVYQNGNFLPGKSISLWEKHQEKWLWPRAPSKNIRVMPLLQNKYPFETNAVVPYLDLQSFDLVPDDLHLHFKIKICSCTVYSPLTISTK